MDSNLLPQTRAARVPENYFGFIVKDFRMQYPGILLDIDQLDVKYLPPGIQYYGQFKCSRKRGDLISIWRFHQQLLLHIRSEYADTKKFFPWSALTWICATLSPFKLATTPAQEFFTNKKTILDHRLSIMRLTWQTFGEPGFWLRDYDVRDPALIAMGIDAQETFMEIYLSDYGLFVAGGLEILQDAQQDALIHERESITSPQIEMAP